MSEKIVTVLNEAESKEAIVEEAIKNFKLAENSIMTERMKLTKALGTTFNGKRDIYAECGYEKVLGWSYYYDKFDRNSVASAIVKAFPESTWAQYPCVYEDETLQETKFEKQWKKLCKKTKLFAKLVRADIMAGIDQYSVIVLGFDDSNASTPEKPVTKASNLLYMKPVLQCNADITKYVSDTTDEKFGTPETYSITFANSDNTASRQVTYHTSRIFHIADNVLDNCFLGTSRLKKIFNRLQDLETIMGASSEMVWKQSFPGINFKADADADLSQSKEELSEEIENFMHGLSRYMKLQGISAEEIKGVIQDPTPIIDCVLKLIATESKIPVRILTGSEEAKLASSTDKQNYQDRVTQRREHFAKPFILEPLVDLLIEYGVLPEVEYKTKWNDVYALSKRDRVDIAERITKALANYAKTPGLDMMMSPKFYLTQVLDFSLEQVEQLELAEYESYVEEEREMILAEKEALISQKESKIYVEGEDNNANPEDRDRTLDKKD